MDTKRTYWEKVLNSNMAKEGFLEEVPFQRRPEGWNRASREERSLGWMERRDKRERSSCEGLGHENMEPLRKLKVN